MMAHFSSHRTNAFVVFHPTTHTCTRIQRRPGAKIEYLHTFLSFYVLDKQKLKWHTHTFQQKRLFCTPETCLWKRLANCLYDTAFHRVFFPQLYYELLLTNTITNANAKCQRKHSLKLISVGIFHSSDDFFLLCLFAVCCLCMCVWISSLSTCESYLSRSSLYIFLPFDTYAFSLLFCMHTVNFQFQLQDTIRLNVLHLIPHFVVVHHSFSMPYVHSVNLEFHYFSAVPFPPICRWAA